MKIISYCQTFLHHHFPKWDIQTLVWASWVSGDRCVWHPPTWSILGSSSHRRGRAKTPPTAICCSALKWAGPNHMMYENHRRLFTLSILWSWEAPFNFIFYFSSLIVNIHFHCFRLTLVELPQCWWVGCIKIDTEPEQRRSITGRLRCISQEPRPGCQLGAPYGPPSPHQNPLLPSPRCLLPS